MKTSEILVAGGIIGVILLFKKKANVAGIGAMRADVSMRNAYNFINKVVEYWEKNKLKPHTSKEHIETYNVSNCLLFGGIYQDKIAVSVRMLDRELFPDVKEFYKEELIYKDFWNKPHVKMVELPKKYLWKYLKWLRSEDYGVYLYI